MERFLAWSVFGLSLEYPGGLWLVVLYYHITYIHNTFFHSIFITHHIERFKICLLSLIRYILMFMFSTTFINLQRGAKPIFVRKKFFVLPLYFTEKYWWFFACFLEVNLYFRPFISSTPTTFKDRRADVHSYKNECISYCPCQGV